jgi:hypothetical protein
MMLTQELDQLTADALAELDEIKARGYWEQVWRRFRSDRVGDGLRDAFDSRSAR